MFCSGYIAKEKEWQVGVFCFSLPEPHTDKQKQHTHFTGSGSEIPRWGKPALCFFWTCKL